MPASRIGASARLGRKVLSELSAPTAELSGAAVESVLHTLAAHFGSPLVVLWALDETTGLLSWQLDHARDDRTAELCRVMRRLTFAEGVGAPGRVLADGEAVRVEDIADDIELPRRELAMTAGLRTVIAAPVRSAEQLIGVLEVFGEDVSDSPAEDLEDLTLVAAQLGGYLGRLRVEERLVLTEQASASIVEAALDCIITMDHRGRVVDFNPAAEATFGYERDEAVGRPLAELIIPPDLRPAHEQALARYLETGEATILGRRMELRGMRADGSTFPIELTVTRLGTRRPPVFAGFLRDIGARRDLETQQATLLREALVARAQAEAAGVRTDDAREEAERALAGAERAQRRISFLAQAGREMAASMDWESTLKTVVRSAVPEIVDLAVLAVSERGGQIRVAALAHSDPGRESEVADYLRGHPREADEQGVARAIRTGAVETLEEPLLSALGVRRGVVVPLATPEGVLGAMLFARGEDAGDFSAEDLDLVTSLAARAALHIHNARLYNEQAHIAHTLQESLQPRALPEIPGVEIAARFRPAGDHNEVGGDFYEVFRSGDGIWTAIVGDVSGKGADAAAVTALARHTLRTSSLLHDDPRTNLELLNRVMAEDSPTSRYCTVVFARLCPGGDGVEIRLSNAGHPAPLVLRADGRVESIESGRGPLVGALAEAQFDETDLHLDPGDLIVMYTDGVTEVQTGDVMLGERELQATLAAHAGAPADAIVAAIERRAVELQDSAPRDDIALLAFRAR